MKSRARDKRVMQRTNPAVGLLLVLAASAAWPCSTLSAQEKSKRPFTVSDEIGSTKFGTNLAGRADIQFSPDGNYFTVWTERGRQDINRVEDSLRFYRSQDIKNFLDHSDAVQPPSPVWTVTLATAKEGSTIMDWRWLADSSGVAFKQRREDGSQGLVLANLQKRRSEALTQAGENVKFFDVRDSRNYVVSVHSQAAVEKLKEERQASAIVGTGRSLTELLFPDDRRSDSSGSNRSHL